MAFGRVKLESGDGHLLLGIALLATAMTPYVPLAAGLLAVHFLEGIRP